jgi:NADH-quinone oxidoreductase subunit M
VLDWTGHGLLLIVALPAAVAFALAFVGVVLSLLGLKTLPEIVWRAVGWGTALLDFGLAWLVLGRGFDPERIGMQLVESFVWSDRLGAHLSLGVDGISLFFLLSTAGLVPLAMAASRLEMQGSVRSWIFACLLLESSLLGGLAATNLLAFAFFWALGLIPVLLWMGRWGAKGRARAASRLWTTESIGLVGLLFVAFVLREIGLEQLGAARLDLIAAPDRPGTLLDLEIPAAEQGLLFVVLVVALASRLPLAPLHFWLPAAQAASPTGLSVLMATGFVQIAAVGLLHFALPLFPEAARSAGPILSVVAIAALVYASLVALVQKELKRLIAYAGVGHAAFAFFGISTLTTQGMMGAVVQLLTHGLAAAGLFLLVGFLALRRQTTEVAAFGGLAKPMPVCAFFFGFMVLSSMGLPLLGGFVGDLFVLLGSFETRRELAPAALVAMIVASSYLFWVQRRIFLGPVEEPANRGLIDLDRVERAILLAIAIPILWIGLYPNPVLRRIEPAVLEVLFQMDRNVGVPGAPGTPASPQPGGPGAPPGSPDGPGRPDGSAGTRVVADVSGSRR